MTTTVRTRQGSTTMWALRFLVAAGLVVDAVIHLRLAGEYQFAFPEGIGGGKLFQVEAGVALGAAAVVIVWGRRSAYWFAFLVAASALVAVVVSRYVELPAVGPLPSMHEPLWFFDKGLSAAAEAVAALASLLLLLMSRRHGDARTGAEQGREQVVSSHPRAASLRTPS